jgi:homoserine O-acetyltransferase
VVRGYYERIARELGLGAAVPTEGRSE